jgi:hypothetical protein
MPQLIVAEPDLTDAGRLSQTEVKIPKPIGGISNEFTGPGISEIYSPLEDKSL